MTGRLASVGAGEGYARVSLAVPLMLPVVGTVDAGVIAG
jgi:hypothetical protein